MNILRGGKVKPFKIRNLTASQIRRVSACDALECGTTPNKILRLPSFCFLASCKKHDLGYRRGGGILDKFESDWTFFKYMCVDIYNLDDAYVNKGFFYVFATVYFVSVFIFGVFAFQWGKYRDFETIMNNV